MRFAQLDIGHEAQVRECLNNCSKLDTACTTRVSLVTMQPAEKQTKKTPLLDRIANQRRNIHNVFLAGCIAGNMWQAYLICATYFAYDIVTAVSVSFPSEFIAPSVTVCFYVLTLIDWRKADVAFPNLRKDMGVDNITGDVDKFAESLRDLTYVDKLKKAHFFVNELQVRDFFLNTFEPEDVVESCTYADPKNYTLVTITDCKQFFNITQYFKEAFSCYTFQTLVEVEYDYPSMQRIKSKCDAVLLLLWTNSISRHQRLHVQLALLRELHEAFERHVCSVPSTRHVSAARRHAVLVRTADEDIHHAVVPGVPAGAAHGTVRDRLS